MKTFGIIVLILGIALTTITGLRNMKEKTISEDGNTIEYTPVYASPITGLVIIAEGMMILIAFKRRKAFLKP